MAATHDRATSAGDAPTASLGDVHVTWPTSWRGWAAWLGTTWLALILALGPWKMAMTLFSYEEGFFPLTLDAWRNDLWPPTLLPIASGLALLLVLTYAPMPTWRDWRRYLPLILPMAGLSVAAGIGQIATSEVDEAHLFLAHMLGCLAFVLAVLLHLRARPESRPLLLAAIAVGLLWNVGRAWSQYLFEMDRERAAVSYSQIYGGMVKNSRMDHAMGLKRVFGNFTNPNNLAAHLVLLIPFVFAAILRGGAQVAIPLQRRILYLVPTVVALGVALVWTESRSAGLAFLLTFNVALLLAVWQLWRERPDLRSRLRQGIVLYVVLGGLLVGAVGYKIQHGRTGMDSVYYRMEYWSAAWRMFRENPWVGGGIGEYSTFHLSVKPATVDEAKLPHNLILNFLAQCGIVGGMAALLFLAQPLWLILAFWRRRLRPVDPWIAGALLAGLAAWLIHALLDFNIQIPATVMLVAIIPCLCVDFAADRADTGTLADDRAAPDSPVVTWSARLACLAIGLAGLWQVHRLPGDIQMQKVSTMTAEQVQFSTFLTNVARNPPPPTPGATPEEAAKEAAELTQEIVDARNKLRPATYFVDATAKVMQLNPNLPHGWWQLARLAQFQGDLQLAEGAYLKVRDALPRRSRVYARLAEIYFYQGRLTEARVQAEEALRRYPSKAEYQEMLIAINAAIAARAAADAPAVPASAVPVMPAPAVPATPDEAIPEAAP